jgi:hypothetical protein
MREREGTGAADGLRWAACAAIAIAFGVELRFLLEYSASLMAGWLVGLAGLLFVWSTRWTCLLLGERVRRVAPALLGWCVVPLPVAGHLLQGQVNLGFEDLHTTGLPVIAYSLGRLCLLLTVIPLCIGAGAAILRRFPSVADGEGGIGWFLCTFFVGASAWGLAGLVLGLFDRLSLAVAGPLVGVVLIAWVPGETAKLVRVVSRWLRAEVLSVDGATGWGRTHLLWCLGCAACLLLAMRGLYPSSQSNDVWSHYLPYYREVLASGSLRPNSVWYHFYVSKGAGLAHLLGVLSDPFAEQLVSYCFILVSALIVGLLVRRLSGETGWALLAVTVFLAVYRTDLLKSHAVFAGFVAFLLWLLAQDAGGARSRRTQFIAAGLSMVYLGIYQPVASVFPATFLGILLALSWVRAELRGVRRLATMALASLVAGVAAVLLLNYAITGLAEVVPIEHFWRFADRERFADSIGTSGVAFLLDQSRSKALPDLVDPFWWSTALRYRQLWSWFPSVALAAAALAALLLAVRERIWRERPVRVHLLILLAFLASVLLVSLLSHSASLLRVLLFTMPVTVVCCVLIVRGASRLLVPARFVRTMTILTSALAIHALAQEFWYLRAVRQIDVPYHLSFYAGARPMADLLHEGDFHLNSPLPMSTVLEVREFIGNEARPLTLGSVQGPAYFLPGRGFLSAVDHTMGPRIEEIVFSEPSEAAGILRDRGVDYVILHLGSPLFSSVAFSRLLEPDSLEEHFSLFARKDDTYVLTWANERSHPIPARLRRVLEWKRKGLLFSIDSAPFGRAVVAAIRSGRTFAGPEAARIAASVAAHGLPEATDLLPENAAFLADLRQGTAQAVRERLPRLAEVARSKEGDFHEELSVLVVKTAQTYVRRTCAAEFGDDVAEILTRKDEREPFGRIYRSRESFRELLGLAPPVSRPAAAVPGNG